jgi:hypothetical protein
MFGDKNGTFFAHSLTHSPFLLIGFYLNIILVILSPVIHEEK